MLIASAFQKQQENWFVFFDAMWVCDRQNHLSCYAVFIRCGGHLCSVTKPLKKQRDNRFGYFAAMWCVCDRHNYLHEYAIFTRSGGHIC